VPFFAFNRSARDRSLSQLIPTWAKQLAESNPQYLRYLHTLPPKQLQSSDTLSQRDLVIKGLASIDGKVPLIFTVDALDECPEEEENTLFRILRELLSSSEVPHFVRFLFTSRPNERIASPFNNLLTSSISIDNFEDTAKDIHTFVADQLRPNLQDMIEDVPMRSRPLPSIEEWTRAEVGVRPT